MKKLLLMSPLLLLLACGKKEETSSSHAAAEDTASVVMVNPSAEYTKVLDETMTNLASKNVAQALSEYADSVNFVNPNGVVTNTKKDLEASLQARVSKFSSIAYNGRIYIAFDVKKPIQKNVMPGVYVTGWMWSTVKNAKGDSVVTPMTLTIHFNKDKKVDFGYSTYDLKGRTDLMAQ